MHSIKMHCTYPADNQPATVEGSEIIYFPREIELVSK